MEELRMSTTQQKSKIGVCFETEIGMISSPASVQAAYEMLRKNIEAFAAELKKDPNSIIKRTFLIEPGTALQKQLQVVNTAENEQPAVVKKNKKLITSADLIEVVKEEEAKAKAKADAAKDTLVYIPTKEEDEAAEAEAAAAKSSAAYVGEADEEETPHIVAEPLVPRKKAAESEQVNTVNSTNDDDQYWLELALAHAGRKTEKTKDLLLLLLSFKEGAELSTLVKAANGKYHTQDISSWLGQSLKKNPYVIKASRGFYKFDRQVKPDPFSVDNATEEQE